MYCIGFIPLAVSMFILNFITLITEMEEAILSLWLQKEQGSRLTRGQRRNLRTVAVQLLNCSALAQATAYGSESVQ